jgi:hypothetical protein
MEQRHPKNHNHDNEDKKIKKEDYPFKHLHHPKCNPLKEFIEEVDPKTGKLTRTRPQSTTTRLRDLPPEKRALFAPKGLDLAELDVSDEVRTKRLEDYHKQQKEANDIKYNQLQQQFADYKRQTEERFDKVATLLLSLQQGSK